MGGPAWGGGNERVVPRSCISGGQSEGSAGPACNIDQREVGHPHKCLYSQHLHRSRMGLNQTHTQPLKHPVSSEPVTW